MNRELPHLGNAGRGVNRELPHLGDAGQEPLQAYMRRLAHRLQRVRITCGDWRRPLSPAAMRAKTGGDGAVAVFLDPPYATSGDLYAEGDSGGTISAAVRQWCAEAPTDLRIVLCGYDDEHDALTQHGWTRVNGRSGGGAGYSTNSANGRREGLWMSPACNVHDQGVLL